VILLADRWYATARFVCTCRELGVGALIRLKRNGKRFSHEHGSRFLKQDVLWTAARFPVVLKPKPVPKTRRKRA
jgi:hypothetical protein